MNDEFVDELRRAFAESIPPADPELAKRILAAVPAAGGLAPGFGAWLAHLLRHWLSVVVVGAVAAGAVAAGAIATAPHPPHLGVYAGYADSTKASGHSGSTSLPSPWQPHGARMAAYDAGAIRVDNLGDDTVTLARVWVDVGGTRYELWGRDLVVPAHGSIQLTQTAVVGTSPFESNFDTSDTAGTTCAVPSDVVPVVHLEIAGVPYQFVDSTQVLNTGGRDKGSCPGRLDEGHQWVLLSRG